MNFHLQQHCVHDFIVNLSLIRISGRSTIYSPECKTAAKSQTSMLNFSIVWQWRWEKKEKSDQNKNVLIVRSIGKNIERRELMEKIDLIKSH
jgi:hypothetical protein